MINWQPCLASFRTFKSFGWFKLQSHGWGSFYHHQQQQKCIYCNENINIFFSSKILENISFFLWCNYGGGGWVNLKSLRGLSLGQEMASTASTTTVLQDCKIFLQAAVHKDHHVYNVLLIQYENAITFFSCLEKNEPYRGAQLIHSNIKGHSHKNNGATHKEI